MKILECERVIKGNQDSSRNQKNVIQGQSLDRGNTHTHTWQNT